MDCFQAFWYAAFRMVKSSNLSRKFIRLCENSQVHQKKKLFKFMAIVKNEQTMQSHKVVGRRFQIVITRSEKIITVKKKKKLIAWRSRTVPKGRRCESVQPVQPPRHGLRSDASALCTLFKKSREKYSPPMQQKDRNHSKETTVYSSSFSISCSGRKMATRQLAV